MCEKCKGDQFKAVRSLFNGDYQALSQFQDREDWRVISPNVIVYLGESALANEENVLYRGCDKAIAGLDSFEKLDLIILARKLGRPAFGGL